MKKITAIQTGLNETEKSCITRLNYFINEFKENKKAFEARLETNFLYALEWAERAAITAEQRDVAIKTLSYFDKASTKEGKTLHTVIVEVLDQLTKEQMRYYMNQSTSIFSNAVEHARAQARVRLIDTYSDMARSLANAKA